MAISDLYEPTDDGTDSQVRQQAEINEKISVSLMFRAASWQSKNLTDSSKHGGVERELSSTAS